MREKKAPQLANILSRISAEIRKRASLGSDGNTGEWHKTSPPEPPLLGGYFGGLLTCMHPFSGPSHGYFVQADVLDGGPDNREATRLGGKHVDLIGALPHIAEEALNSIGGLNVAVHGDRELVKREEMLLILRQTAHRLRIAFAVFGLEGGELDHGLLFAGLLPDAHQFNL